MNSFRPTFFIPTIMILGLTLSSCTSATPVEPVDQPPMPAIEAAPEPTKTVVPMGRHPIPAGEFGPPPFYYWGYEREDCIGVENGESKGGDLLSSLISDDEARAGMKLAVYTADYVKNLQAMLDQKTRENGEEVYAFYACHVAEGIDLVAGKRWPRGKSTEFNEKTTPIDESFLAQKPKLYLIQSGEIREFSDIQVENNTATGAETYPCTAEMKKESVEWTCFQGLAFDENDPEGGVTGSRTGVWHIPLNGDSVIYEQKS